MADPRNRERGLKAAIHNPRVSEEAKQHDRELLESEFGEHIEASESTERRPRRSSAGVGKSTSATAQGQSGQSSSMETEQSHPAGRRKSRRASVGEPGGGELGGLQQMADEKERGNIIRGLKAALKNPHVSEKAKEADREKLRALGETVE